MSTFPVTKTERRFLFAVQALTAKSHLPPTLREIAAYMHASSNSHVCYLREAMELCGYVTFIPGVHRSLMLTDAGLAFLAGESEVAS